MEQSCHRITLEKKERLVAKTGAAKGVPHALKVGYQVQFVIVVCTFMKLHFPFIKIHRTEILWYKFSVRVVSIVHIWKDCKKNLHFWTKYRFFSN